MVGKRLSKLDAPKHITNEEKVMRDQDFIVSKTDTKGFITYCNEIFVDMAGWEAHELIGANHNIIRHPDMPRIAFKVVWETIKAKKEFFGFVKNLRKNGGFYWVFAYITPDLDSNGNIIGYSSFRRQPPRSAIETITTVYKLLLDAEARGGMEASGKLLDEFLADHNTTYNEFVINLQKGMEIKL